MRHPTGYLQTFGPGAKTEADTFTCGHCNSIVIVKPKCDPADLGGLCKTCMKFICPKCAAKNGCDPHEEKLQRAERRFQFLRDVTAALK